MELLSYSQTDDLRIFGRDAIRHRLAPRTSCLAAALALGVLAIAGCAYPVTATSDKPANSTAPSGAATAPAPEQAARAIDAADMLGHIRTLASDDFEGRSPGTEGERRTVQYLEQQFRSLGLAPGNPDGSYVQQVPMTAHRSVPSLGIDIGTQHLELATPADFVAWSYERSPEVRIEKSEMVFVGYGVIAPEYDWDDYKGMDLHGKTLVMLINDPQIPDPRDPDKLDESMFKGKAMTYYGRWTYKFEMAARLGAAAAIIVHETVPAAYPYSVVVNSNTGENFDIHTGGPNPDFPRVPAWMNSERARALFAACGQDFDALKKAALRRDFRPVTLGARATFDVRNTWRDIESRNVLARIEGSDPARRDDLVIYSAHWDHFGWNPALPGDKHAQIFHGALDNASGVAALLELARAYRALPQAPRSSILLLATTGEERGLIGARYYAQHPLYPLARTLADINIDTVNPWGKTRDLEVVGFGNSTLEDLITSAALEQHRIIVPDSHPERGSFFRADHLEFARVGVPSLYTSGGKDYLGQTRDFGDRKKDEFIAGHYHKVTDTVQPDWNLDGAVEDIGLLFRVGQEVADGAPAPQWRDGSEFRRIRERSLAGAAHH